MLKLPFFLLLFILALGACTEKSTYQILERTIEFSKTEDCEVVHQYPEIEGLKDSLQQEGINRYMREESGLFKAAAACLEGPEKIKVRSDYYVYHQTDTLLSIELRKKVWSEERQEFFNWYYPISFKLPEGYWQPLEMSLDEKEWSKLNLALQDWNREDPENRHYNAASYVWGDSDLIPFCWSSDSLILYPGGEGESHSQQKFAIAFSDLK